MSQGPQTPFSDSLHAQKYRGPGEGFREYANRVAGVLAPGDDFKPFRDILLEQRFLPAGRIQQAIGSTRETTPFNCYLSGTIEDSLTDGHGSIMSRAKQAARTMQMGGGIGYDFSTLRPRGATIRKLGSRSSGPISFMGIFNAICLTIASAGHRRGAQMGVMRIDHPDIEEFIRAKQDSVSLTGFNVSIAVTDEFMEAVRDGGPFDLRWGGEVYRTVDARALWDMVMRSTWDWAEPGVLFIDRINKRNPLYYCETIAATNPCLAAGTLVSTPDGFRPVEEIAVGDRVATINGNGTARTIEHHRDVPVFRVELSDGTELRATAAHIFHVQEGKWFNKERRLDSLEPGDRLRMVPSAMPDREFRQQDVLPDLSDRDYGLVIGAVIGDGCYTPKTKQTKIACHVNEKAWRDVLLSIIPDAHENVSTESCVVVASTTLTKHLDRSPLSRGYSHEKALPLELLNSNQDFLAGFIDGLISTDGNVHMSKSNPMIRVAGSSRESLLMLKRALSCFGILARLYPEKSKSVDSTTEIAGRTVTRSAQGHVLVILGSGIRTLHDRIGLSHPDKASRLRTLVSEYSLTGCTWTASIKSIEPDGVADVFDIYEPETDTWITDSVVNRGCGEQPLPPFGACLLGSFNLVKYLRWVGDNDHAQSPSESGWVFNHHAFARDVRLVVPAMDRVIDVAKYPLYEQEKEAQSKRRMGLGVTGLANTIEAMGYAYGSPGFLLCMEEILTTLRNEAYAASAFLAKKRGSFPVFDADHYLLGQFAQTLPKDVRELIRHYGLRNSHLLSIAPTGTISLTADNVSSGIEPVYAYEADRTIQEFDGPATYHVEDYGVKFLGVRGKTADQVTADEHVAVLCTAARYVDSAVSKTCNVSPDMPWEEFKGIYMKAWKGGAKGCTTFNPGGKRMGILQAKSEEPAACRITEDGRRECE